jgi:hypothetical protein
MTKHLEGPVTRRPVADLPCAPDRLTLAYQYHQYLNMTDVFSETVEQWTVTVHAPGDFGAEDGPVVGELRLFRMRGDAGASWTMAADSESGDLLRIIETVMEDDQFSSVRRSRTRSRCRTGISWSWTWCAWTSRCAGSAWARSWQRRP